MEPLRNDPQLGPLVEAHGDLSIGTADDEFERLVVAIVNQQLSVDSAAAIRERLFDRVDVSPAGILAADESTLPVPATLEGLPDRFRECERCRYADVPTLEDAPPADRAQAETAPWFVLACSLLGLAMLLVGIYGGVL